MYEFMSLRRSVTLVVVTLHVRVIEESLVEVDVYPVGRVPVTVKVNESLLGSSATTVIVAVVLTVTLNSVGPLKIFGG